MTTKWDIEYSTRPSGRTVLEEISTLSLHDAAHLIRRNGLGKSAQNTGIECLVRKLDGVENRYLAEYFSFVDWLVVKGAVLTVEALNEAVKLVVTHQTKSAEVNATTVKRSVCVIKHLIDAGAPIEHQNIPKPTSEWVEYYDRDVSTRWGVSVCGFSPLHHAAQCGNPDVCAFLLNAGADLEVRSWYGMTPLLVAAANSHAQVLKLLLDAGADFSATTNDRVDIHTMLIGCNLAVKDVINLHLRHRTGWRSRPAATGSFRPSELIHRTVTGDLVRSKSEVIIANALHYAGVSFVYEQHLPYGQRGASIVPDFTIAGDSERPIIWEHFGMLGDASYRTKWEAKLEIYRELGFRRGVDFFVTVEDAKSGIDSYEVQEIAERIKGQGKSFKVRSRADY